MPFSIQAMRVAASGPNLIETPEIDTDPLNWLHEPFPAACPAPGNPSVACGFSRAGDPARSRSTHCVPTRETLSAVAAGFPGLTWCVEEQARIAPIARRAPAINEIGFISPPWRLIFGWRRGCVAT